MELKLIAEPRESKGKGGARKTRAAGRVPGILYGHGSDPLSVSDPHALTLAYADPEAGTGGLKPYLHVRRDLWARLTRPLFYDLVALGEERDVEGRRMFGVASSNSFFPMAPAETLREFA